MVMEWLQGSTLKHRMRVNPSALTSSFRLESRLRTRSTVLTVKASFAATLNPPILLLLS